MVVLWVCFLVNESTTDWNGNGRTIYYVHRYSVGWMMRVGGRTLCTVRCLGWDYRGEQGDGGKAWGFDLVWMDG